MGPVDVGVAPLGNLYSAVIDQEDNATARCPRVQCCHAAPAASCFPSFAPIIMHAALVLPLIGVGNPQIFDSLNPQIRPNHRFFINSHAASAYWVIGNDMTISNILATAMLLAMQNSTR